VFRHFNNQQSSISWDAMARSPPRFLIMARRVLVKLPGPVRTIEFMALAGNARQRPGHEKQEKQFHRANV